MQLALAGRGKGIRAWEECVLETEEGVCECSCFESEKLIETRRAGLINTLKGFAIGDNYKTERERAKRLADGCLLFIPLSAQSTRPPAPTRPLFVCSQLCGFYLVRPVWRQTTTLPALRIKQMRDQQLNIYIFICLVRWRFIAHRKQKGEFGPDELIQCASLPSQNK